MSLLFLVTGSYAQQKAILPAGQVKENGISIIAGFQQFKDENLHPKVFHGPAFGFSYLHSGVGRNISEYSTGLKFSAINTNYESFPSAFSIIIQGNYRYLFYILNSDKFSWYLGPAADLQYGANAYFNWDESHLYYANYLGTGAGNRVSYVAGKKTFEIDLVVPVISVVCRPNLNRRYKIDDMTVGGVIKNMASNPEIALPNSNFYLKTDLDMKFHFGRGKSGVFGYNFIYHYVHTSNGNPYQNIEHSFFYKFIF